ncbi:phospholipid transport system transporter-binding protein [Methylohalomonas lacus]|uniref:Phospholipid transport system transporter-binding protein n=1 Tax=Methylohalomonas lacus TaxID=398773 RepID=A0AAE3HH77_9GAMM|nr:STAS domain-containing protein [Methylohalomonas lacus]MCS3902226.1 phospholipid transport system transporter-binding protein [Methylohalomonas lacus]
MSDAVLHTATGDTWKVEGDLNYATSARLHESARAAMAEQLPGSVDLAAVERVDSAGVALMIDWIRAARARQQNLTLHNVPEHMRRIADLCGVAHLFKS